MERPWTTQGYLKAGFSGGVVCIKMRWKNMPESEGHWKLKFSRKRNINGGPFRKPRRRTMVWVASK